MSWSLQGISYDICNPLFGHAPYRLSGKNNILVSLDHRSLAPSFNPNGSQTGDQQDPQRISGRTRMHAMRGVQF